MNKIVEKQITKAAVSKIVASDISKSKKIQALFDGGIEIGEIAKLLDIRYQFAYNVCSNYINQHNLEEQVESKSPVNSKRSVIIQMLQEGKTVKEIAKATETYQNYVYKISSELAKAAMSKAE